MPVKKAANKPINADSRDVRPIKEAARRAAGYL